MAPTLRAKPGGEQRSVTMGDSTEVPAIVAALADEIDELILKVRRALIP